MAADSTTAVKECRICGHRDTHPIFRAREMMFGSRHEFEYYECSRCGCVQIERVPANLRDYYPEDYYSLARGTRCARGAFRRAVKRWATNQYLGKRSLAGWLLTQLIPRQDAHSFYDWLPACGATCRSRILDVGSGRGDLILTLYNEGFEDLTAVDPYLDTDIIYGPGCRVLKQDFCKHDGQYDVITAHHSFEHMANQHTCMKHIADLLADGGTAMIAVPVASFAWREYRADWVQLDAPRHLYLHTETSFRMLAKKSGLRIDRIDYYSGGFQFWGSEQYRRDIPLFDERSYRVNSARSIFSKRDIEQFRARAEELNAKGKGDQARFFLTRTA